MKTQMLSRIAQSLRRTAVRSRLRRRPQADGFNLVVLAVMITVMNVMLAKALPMWSHVIERDQESELIFRGMQYAEAIRVFKLRFNRQPVRLKELIEVEPRAIRQLWNNPLSPEAVGKPPEGIGWGLIFQGQPVVPENQQGDQGDQPRDLGRSPDRNESRSIFDDQPEEKVEVGPILGVYSKVGGEAIRVFCDSDTVEQWRFTSAMLELAVGVGGGQGPVPVAINSELIGRPLPPGVTPPRNIGTCGGAAQRGNNLGNPGGGRGRGRNLNPDTGAPNTDKQN